jgi:uncharacterized membrane protein
MALMSARDARAADADADRTVRLAAPSLGAVVRIVAIVVACAVLLYLAWRLRDVLRLTVVSVFLALALEHVAKIREDVDAKRAEHDVDRAQRNAENAEDDATFAVEYAYAAIEEAEYAVLDAALARKKADELAAA